MPSPSSPKYMPKRTKSMHLYKTCAKMFKAPLCVIPKTGSSTDELINNCYVSVRCNTIRHKKELTPETQQKNSEVIQHSQVASWFQRVTISKSMINYENTETLTSKVEINFKQPPPLIVFKKKKVDFQANSYPHQ